jgi:NAD(P)-dependent dehydrogenase (short-subunit alcohol dehydrogenase family)
MTSTPMTCWITGASSGIGRELALRLAAAGHTVWISARSGGVLQALAQEYPLHLLPLPCDISDSAAMAALFTDPALGNNGSVPQALDLVILCAGICEYIDLPNLDTASIRRNMDVNFHGTVNAAAAALPLLRAAHARNPARKPELVGVSSMSAYVGFPRAEGYGASKAALAYFLDALRCDVQQDLDVTVVYPGFVATPMTDRNDFAMPFLQTTAEAADHILARLGRGRRSISFPWQLHWLLKLAALLPALWYGPVMRSLSRQQRKAQA